MFPELDAETVLANVERRWDLSYPVPIPRSGWLCCPVCGHDDPQPRWWQWHTRQPNATIPYRCDVTFKCVDCSMVWLHGVAVPAEYFRANAKRQKTKLTWREVKKLMRQHDASQQRDD